MQPHNKFFSKMIEGRSTVAMPPNSVFLNHSANTSFFRESVNQGYSLKYVYSGVERYEVNQKSHTVTQGNFLLVGHGSETKVEIDAPRPVEGFCFYLSTALVQDAWTSLNADAEYLLDNNVKLQVEIYENTFSGEYDALGQLLTCVAKEIKLNDGMVDSLNEEFFHSLALGLCRQQRQCHRQLTSLDAHKKTTRDELYRRLLMARDFIHDNIAQDLSLAEMTRIATISEFHFVRSFKTVFGYSPYQYLLQQRLQKAKELLLMGDRNISDIAFDCGFNEVQAFSKLFRRATGVGPSNFRLACSK